MRRLLLLSMMLLKGCTPYTEQFECVHVKNTCCKPLSAINRLVDEGKLPLEDLSQCTSITDQGIQDALNKASLKHLPSNNEIY